MTDHYEQRPTETNMAPLSIVEALVAAINAGAVHRIKELLAPDVTYLDPAGPESGAHQVTAALSALMLGYELVSIGLQMTTSIGHAVYTEHILLTKETGQPATVRRGYAVIRTADGRIEDITHAYTPLIQPSSTTPHHDVSVAPGETEMTESEANKKIVLDVFEAWQRGAGSIESLFADDLTWEIVGRSAAAGTYTREEFVDDVLAPIGRRFTRHGVVRPTRIRVAVADGDWVIVIWDGSGVTDADTVYDNTYAWCMQLRDGLIHNAIAFYDSIAFDRMWAVPPTQ